MAFSVVKLHTGVNTKTSSTSMTATLTSNVPSGNALLFAIVHDNVQQSPDSSPNPTGSVARLNTTNPPSAGVYSALWVGTGNTSSETTGGLYYVVSDGSSSFNSGATFTFGIYGNASVAAKVLSVAEVSGLDFSSRYEVAIPGASVATSYSRNLTSPAADYVHFFLVGTENNAAPTLDADLTQIDAIATTGGGAASNVGLAWGYNDPNSTATFTYSGTVSDGGWASMAIKVASTGPQTYQASGTHAASSAVAGVVLATLLAAGSTAASTTLSGDPTVHLGTQSASGTVPASSGGSGGPNSRLLSSGTSAASAGSTGAVVLKSPAAGTSAATVTTSGSPTIRLGTQPAAGTVAASAGTAGTVVTKSQAAGVNAASATVSGTLTARLLAAGTSAATSTTVSGDVQIYSTIKVASGTITVTTATTGAVSLKSQAAGNSPSTAGTAGSVFTIRPGAAGVIAGVSAVSGDATKTLGPQTFSAAGTVLAIASGSGAVRAYLRVTGQSVVSTSTAGTLVARFKANGTNPAVVSTVGSPNIYGVAPALGYWGVRI